MLMTSFKYEGKYNVEIYYLNNEGCKFTVKVFTLGRYPRLVYKNRATIMSFVLDALKNIEWNIEHNPPKRNLAALLED